MILVVCPWLFSKNFRGLAIFPFIFLKDKVLKENQTMLHHEKIHFRQQIEMLLVFFYLWYLIEFLIRWIQFKNPTQAYANISFEKEAYANESNFNYLKNRKFAAFARYL